MSIHRIHVATVLPLVLALASLVAPAFAEGWGRVTSANPTAIRLEAGGSPIDVALAGTDLDKPLLLLIRKESAGGPQEGISLALGPYGTAPVTTRRMTVHAASSVPPGSYRLFQVNLDGEGQQALPLAVHVVAKGVFPPMARDPGPLPIPPAPPAAAVTSDLTITEVKFDPSPCVSGQPVTIRVRIQNLGQRPAIVPEGAILWEAKVPHSGVVRWAYRLSEGALVLAAGASDTRSVASIASLAPGTYAVSVRADPGEVTADSARGNDRRQAELVVRAPPSAPFPPR